MGVEMHKKAGEQSGVTKSQSAPTHLFLGPISPRTAVMLWDDNEVARRVARGERATKPATIGLLEELPPTWQSSRQTDYRTPRGEA